MKALVNAMSVLFYNHINKDESLFQTACQIQFHVWLQITAMFSHTYLSVTNCHSVSCCFLISTQYPVTMQPPSYGGLHHATLTELPLPHTEGLPAGGSAGPNEHTFILRETQQTTSGTTRQKMAHGKNYMMGPPTYILFI